MDLMYCFELRSPKINKIQFFTTKMAQFFSINSNQIPTCC